MKETPKDFNLIYNDVQFPSNGDSLKSWYIPASKSKAIVIIVHGYLDVKAVLLEHAVYLHDNGYATFLIDLRSDSSKRKAMLGISEYKDVEAAYDYLKSLLINKTKKIGFFGGSMGAVSCIIELGKTGKGDFLIASVPYANFTSLFKKRLQGENLPQFFLPFLQLAAIFELGWGYWQFSSDKLIKNIHVPLLFSSADNDSIVDRKDAKLLYNLANKPKYYWNIATDHNIFKERPEEFKKHVLNFLKKLD